LAVAGLLVLVLALAGAADAARLVGQVKRVALPQAQAPAASGETWLLVAADDTATLADLIVLAQVPAGQDRPSALLAVPRDLLVQTGEGSRRLGLTLGQSPAELAGALCTGLGVPVDHLVMVEARGLAAAIDAAGGLTIDLGEPMADASAGFDLAGGPQRVSGAVATAILAYRGLDGREAETGDAVKTEHSAAVGGAVLAKLGEAIGGWRGLRRMAAATGGTLTVDYGTNLFQAARVIGAIDGPLQALTVEATATQAQLLASPQTMADLAALGYQAGGCTVEGL
jgi:hypothetical protein